jgi:hypothetical protein
VKNETRRTAMAPLQPCEPYEPKREHFNTDGALERTIIYHDVEVIGDCDIDLEEYFADMEEELPHPKLNFNQITLQDIIDLAPPDAKLSDIKLNISYPRMAEYLEVKFEYFKRDLEAEEGAFQEHMKEYQKDYTQYQQDLKKYQEELADYKEWERLQEVKELEAKLAKLKK